MEKSGQKNALNKFVFYFQSCYGATDIKYANNFEDRFGVFGTISRSNSHAKYMVQGKVKKGPKNYKLTRKEPVLEAFEVKVIENATPFS